MRHFRALVALQLLFLLCGLPDCRAENAQLAPIRSSPALKQPDAGGLTGERSAKLSRGPYLQRLTSTGVIVRWRTADASESVVRYGTSPQALRSVIRRGAAVTDHRVELDGLKPSTTYYYSVGSGSEGLESGADLRFQTAPPRGSTVPVRIWVVGDSGTGDSHARAVMDAYIRYAGNKMPHLWLMLGDNAYETGTDAEFQRGLFDIYRPFLVSTPLWPVAGNHELYSGADSNRQTGAYYDAFSLPKKGEAGGVASETEAYYSFDYANIHFVALESSSLDKSPDGAMASWLKRDLAANRQTWTIAFFHDPPHTDGKHNSDNLHEPGYKLRQNILPVLEQYGVDLMLTGHCHAYERSYLIDGYYGTSGAFDPVFVRQGGTGRRGEDGPYRKKKGQRHGGSVLVVAGNAGKLECGNFNHPVMLPLSSHAGGKGICERGSLAIEVKGNSLDLKFIDRYSEVRDWFAIEKTP